MLCGIAHGCLNYGFDLTMNAMAKSAKDVESSGLITLLQNQFVAILFGKVLRIQSHAQVIFCDPLLIRYGSGVECVKNQEDCEEGLEQTMTCPVLEFRIVNRLSNEVGGEIMDGTSVCECDSQKERCLFHFSSTSTLNVGCDEY